MVVILALVLLSPPAARGAAAVPPAPTNHPAPHSPVTRIEYDEVRASAGG